MSCRRTRKYFVVLILVMLMGLSSRARARCTDAVRKQIERLNTSAMEDYDLLEFESANQTLLDAARLARNKGCDRDIVAARTFVSQGVLYIQGFNDESRGKLMFQRALKITPKVTLDRQLATPKLLRLFNEVRRSMGLDAPDAPDDVPPVEDPVAVPDEPPPEPEKPAQGLEHSPIDEAPRASPLKVTARVGTELEVARVILFYRVMGMEEYAALPLSKRTEWTWDVEIPGSDIEGKMVYYYIEARSSDGRPLAASGNAASPHIIMLTAPVAEDPFVGRESPFKDKEKEKEKRKREPGDLIGVYISIGGGLSTGYVGNWPGDLSGVRPKRPGFAMGTFDGMLEVGYFLSPKMLLTGFFKLGYAQSDISEVPVLGWQGMARFRYVALGAKPGSFFRLFFGAGLGVAEIYHSLTLDNNVDTFHSGPGLVISALAGAWIGTEKVGAFIELDPKVLFDFTTSTSVIDGSEIQHGNQHTFSLGIAAGLYLSF